MVEWKKAGLLVPSVFQADPHHDREAAGVEEARHPPGADLRSLQASLLHAPRLITAAPGLAVTPRAGSPDRRRGRAHSDAATGSRARPRVRHAARRMVTAGSAPRARPAASRPAWDKDAAMAHELEQRRKLAHHRGTSLKLPGRRGGRDGSWLWLFGRAGRPAGVAPVTRAAEAAAKEAGGSPRAGFPQRFAPLPPVAPPDNARHYRPLGALARGDAPQRWRRGERCSGRHAARRPAGNSERAARPPEAFRSRAASSWAALLK